MRKNALLLVAFLSIMSGGLFAAGTGEPGSEGYFRADWSRAGMTEWRAVDLSSRPTRFVSIFEEGRQVLMGRSHDSASALYIPLVLPLSETANLSWRWKVTRALPVNDLERHRSGDDYAARVLVSFGPDLFSKESRALCYVWASREAVGELYESPYSNSVATIVVESGTAKLGEWVLESANIVEDYRRAFGSAPETAFALAVMVDSDNTDSRATAWFSDIQLQP